VVLQVRDRHAEELWAMAKGIYELRTRLREIGEPICDDIHAYLDRFYLKVGRQTRTQAHTRGGTWPVVAVAVSVLGWAVLLVGPQHVA
jgi:hypothetical protein